ncbi:hypothetical protein [Herbaspirillum sp. ST 5-3]|uniref:hypothetical protein n=1 Tax=Oxalobacteraceae TaxID=75682 RepID=UPI0010A34CB3|nr:hypothetical protein [Herbaspirillum sp. ST 5-3]
MMRKSSTASRPDFSMRLGYCMLAIVALVGAALYWRGFDLWTIILICIALICPVVMLWGLALLRKDKSQQVDDAEKSERTRY